MIFRSRRNVRLNDFSEPSECPAASRSIGRARRNVRRALRVFGELVGMSESFSARLESLSECPKASPRVWRVCWNVRKLLRVFGEPVGMFGEPVGMSESFSARLESPSECPKASPCVWMVRRNVRWALCTSGRPVDENSGYFRVVMWKQACLISYFT